MFNSHPMDVVLNDTQLSYRLTGGVIDLYFLLGPTPSEVVQQYTEMVGRPVLAPMWSLGYGQSRWGYADLNTTKSVIEQYAASQIPLDVIYSERDYTAEYNVLTLDPSRYPPDQMQNFHDQYLPTRQLQHVYMVDAAVSTLLSWQGAPYSPYVRGLAAGIFIKTPMDALQALQSGAWPTAIHANVSVVYPDFTHAAAADWWRQCIQDWFDVGGSSSGTVAPPVSL